MPEWNVEPTPTFDRKHEKYSNKRRLKLALQAVMANFCFLQDYLENNIGQIYDLHGKSWLKPEPMGIYRISEKGGHGSNLPATRLYFYPEIENKTIHLLTIGDKNTQPQDIQFCKEQVKNLRKGREHG